MSGDLFLAFFLLGGMLTLGFGAYCRSIDYDDDGWLIAALFIFALWPILTPMMIGERLRKRAASVDTLPKGQDAKQGLAGTEGSAVTPKAGDAQPQSRNP